MGSNSKACNIRSKTVEKKGFHWDSKSRVETKDEGLKTNRWRTGMQDFYTALTTDDNDEPIEEPIIQPDDPDEQEDHSLDHLLRRIYSNCHFEDDYDPKFFIRREFHHRESWLPEVLQTDSDPKMYSTQVVFYDPIVIILN